MSQKQTSRPPPVRPFRGLAPAAVAFSAALVVVAPPAAAQDSGAARGGGTMVEVDADTGRASDPRDVEVDVDTSPLRDAGPRANSVDGRPDKSRYSLFDPTPRALMRPLATDRPDTTESAYTVDAGHFQVELSFFEFARDAVGAATECALVPFNLKAGLTNTIDLQPVVDPFIDIDVDGFDGGGGGASSGFGAIELRAKFNLWGNDGGGAPFDLPSSFPDSMRDRRADSAFALMPYVRFPTGNGDVGPDEVEFGLVAPLSTPINDVRDVGLMGDLGLVRGTDDGSYKLEFLHTLVFGRNLGGRLGGYGEYSGVLTGRDGGDYLAALGVGLTYEPSRDAQLDAGLNDEAEDFRFFTGISFRR